MENPGHEEVERALAAIEGRAFTDAADALAALAEAARAVSETWAHAPLLSGAGERERLLGDWLRRLMVVADRAALYFDGSAYSITVGFPAGVSIGIAAGGGAPPAPRRRLQRRAP